MTIIDAAVSSSLQVGDHIVAVHATDDAGCVLRLAISDIAYLQQLRDSFLSGQFEQGFAHALSELSRPWLGGELLLWLDRTQFAERYETSVLRLDKLTAQQLDKVHECRGDDCHIVAAAGTGKTFIALQLVHEALHAPGNQVPAPPPPLAATPPLAPAPPLARARPHPDLCVAVCIAGRAHA